MVFSSSADDSGWVPSPFPGVAYNFLKLGGANPAVVALRKISAGSIMPPHRHPTVERNYLVSGRAQLLDGSIVEAGTYLEIAAGVRHGATALEECVFHDSYDGSLVWVEDSGQMTAVNSTGGFDTLGTMNAPNSSNLDI
ncbi:MAG: cupin domain-containing protein [Chlorobia bacterium]|nr:cupin domain-containing protein [Fimbriimonadaceae bacterium]